MKLLSSYKKELLLALRGFYFYVEIGTAIILLIILLFGVKEHSTRVEEEFFFAQMPEGAQQLLEEEALGLGTLLIGEDREWILRPTTFKLTDKESGESKEYNFLKERVITTRTLEEVAPSTNRVVRRVYQTESLEDLYQLTYQERKLGAVLWQDTQGESSYHYLLQGYETDRLVETLYMIHNADMATLLATAENQQVRSLGLVERLNNRENAIPLFLTFAGSLMGFFIVVSYVFLDKAEGVITAYAVAPVSIRGYLISKVMVICTMVCISSSIITIPIMGAQPHYLILYLFLLITTVTFALLGLFIASFFENMGTSFGVLYAIMILLMLPSFSYMIPGFDPIWLRILPTYPVLEGYKDILLGSQNLSLLWIYMGVFLVSNLLLLELTSWRFKKSL